MRETSSKVTLSGVPETMLQTVYARAKETQNRGAVRDEKAVEIIRRLDYDFSLADKDSAMSSGVIARTIVLDKLVKTYLSAHPGAVAVNIACGLDTRCYRMQGYQHWYNLDLPETIAVREKLLPENGKISQIAMSAMDDWGGMIRESGDALVIIEGLTMYLSEADVQRIFDVIARRFPRVTVLVEVMNPLVVRNFKEKSIEGSHAKFTWGVRSGQALAALLPGTEVSTTDEAGISGDDMEALAFAWLAWRTLAGLPGNLPSVTGASEASVLGAIFPANPPQNRS